MWTDAAKDATLVRDTITDRQARRLMYQARVNLELFNRTRGFVHEALEKLNFHDFARAHSSHMREGIFGADKHRAMQVTYKERVIGSLLALVTAGHRFSRSLHSARRIDRGRDWKELRTDLKLLEVQYHKVRNFMEHLDESIASGDAQEDMDCSFTPHAILTCEEGGESFTFDFSEDALQRPQKTYEKVVGMLESRKSEA